MTKPQFRWFLSGRVKNVRKPHMLTRGHNDIAKKLSIFCSFVILFPISFVSFASDFFWASTFTEILHKSCKKSFKATLWDEWGKKIFQTALEFCRQMANLKLPNFAIKITGIGMALWAFGDLTPVATLIKAKMCKKVFSCSIDWKICLRRLIREEFWQENFRTQNRNLK